MSRNSMMLLVLLSMSLFTGCAGLQPGYESPSVNVTSFRMLPTDGIIPRFEIGLRVINPNRTALELEGISYFIEIEGHKIVSGVSKGLPHIGGYSEGDITLEATANLLSGIRLITDLMHEKRNTFSYGFDAKLDTGGWRPSIHVKEYGEFTLKK